MDTKNQPKTFPQDLSQPVSGGFLVRARAQAHSRARAGVRQELDNKQPGSFFAPASDLCGLVRSEASSDFKVKNLWADITNLRSSH